jgi:hypothetical protein
MLKVVLGHLGGLPGAPKRAKKVLCSSGIKGKPDDFFPISVTPIKIENQRGSTICFVVLVLLVGESLIRSNQKAVLRQSWPPDLNCN